MSSSILNFSLVAVFQLNLEDMSNTVLATANNGLTGFGKISGCALQPFMDKDLCDSDGVIIAAKEEFTLALTTEINNRILEGTWK